MIIDNKTIFVAAKGHERADKTKHLSSRLYIILYMWLII